MPDMRAPVADHAGAHGGAVGERTGATPQQQGRKRRRSETTVSNGGWIALGLLLGDVALLALVTAAEAGAVWLSRMRARSMLVGGEPRAEALRTYLRRTPSPAGGPRHRAQFRHHRRRGVRALPRRRRKRPHLAGPGAGRRRQSARPDAAPGGFAPPRHRRARTAGARAFRRWPLRSRRFRRSRLAGDASRPRPAALLKRPSEAPKMSPRATSSFA